MAQKNNHYEFYFFIENRTFEDAVNVSSRIRINAQRFFKRDVGAPDVTETQPAKLKVRFSDLSEIEAKSFHRILLEEKCIFLPDYGILLKRTRRRPPELGVSI